MKANIEQRGGRHQIFEEKKARLSKVCGIKLKGDFERRSGWSNTENKADCFECGNSERFKAQCPIWIQKKKKWAGERPTNTKGGPKAQKGQGKGIAVHFACLESEKMTPGKEEIPAGEVNLAYRLTK